MIRLLVAAARSGQGKTALACALLRLLRRRGLDPCAFKCGPDYIDPMFHRSALGVGSRNLDLFLTEPERMRELFARGCEGHDAAVCEGAMGLYDGVGGTDRASAWHTAETLNLPVVLSFPARGASLTLAAELRGLLSFRSPSHIAGVVLSQCAAKRCADLRPILERETGVPVLGCLPTVEAARLPSRHLGLYTAREVAELQEKLDALADALEKNADVDRLLSLYTVPERMAAPAGPAGLDFARGPGHARPAGRIAIASDEAFCFCYADTPEALREAGAETVFFSPLRDAALPPETDGLYLPGGYPELHAEALAENASMRRAVADAVRGGMPTVAECGGFLYLSASLRDPEGRDHPMCGVLPGTAADAGRLVRFGYAALCPERDSLLFRAGERVPVHEFHRWESTDCGADLAVEKGTETRRCGFVSETLYAAFPHLYFPGNPVLARRFAEAAAIYRSKR